MLNMLKYLVLPKRQNYKSTNLIGLSLIPTKSIGLIDNRVDALILNIPPHIKQT